MMGRRKSGAECRGAVSDGILVRAALRLVRGGENDNDLWDDNKVVKGMGGKKLDPAL
jgi:hypothetical protein